jgi:hypothetical protein
VRTTRRPSEWGSGGQLDAVLDSFTSIASEPFDWLVVLSGQDYPVRPVEELAELFAATPHQLFLDTSRNGVVYPPPPGRDALTYAQERYFYRYRWLPASAWSRFGPRARRSLGAGSQRLARLLSSSGALRVQRRPENRFSPGLGVRARRHPFTTDRPCRMGSDWFAIARPVYDDLLEQMARSPDLVEHFRRTYLPTEAFFHTFLLPRWDAQNAGHNLHYLRFVGSRAHPEMVSDDDWAELVDSGAYFARKFDATHTALLDRIDRVLLSS